MFGAQKLSVESLETFRRKALFKALSKEPVSSQPESFRAPC